MMNYKTYKEKSDVILIEEAEALFDEMIKEEYLRDEEFTEIYRELMDKVIRYAEIRSKWFLLDRQERMEKDEGRSRLHDSMIVSFNMLARYMASKGWDHSWRAKLGEQRKRIGDFACYIAYVYGINAR